MKRFAPAFVPGLLLLLLSPFLLVTPRALAANPWPAWVDQWTDYWANFLSTDSSFGLNGSGLQIMQPQNIKDSYNHLRPSPAGTDFDTALSKGYTDFYVPGNTQPVDMYTVAHDIYTAPTQAVDGKGKILVSLNDVVTKNEFYEDAIAQAYPQSRKLTATSTTLSKTMESTGMTASQVEGAAKVGVAENNKNILKNAAALAEKNKKPEASALKTLATRAAPAASRVLRVVNTAGDVVMAQQFGVWVGNGIVGAFHIDNSGECDAVTNGFGRWALGISDKCNSLELQKQTVEAFSQSSITSHGLEAIGVTITGHHQHLDTYCGGTRDVYTAQLTPSDTDRSSISFYVDGSDHLTDVFEGPVVCAWSGWLKPGTTAAYSASSSGTVEFVGPSPAWLTSHTLKLYNHPEANISFETINTVAPVALTADVTGSDGQHYTSTGPSASADQPLTIPTVSLPDGVTPTTVTYNISSPDDSTLPTQQVFATSLPAADLSGKTLDLIQVSTGKSCYNLADACASWASEVQSATGSAVTLSNSATTSTTSTLPYKCTWGGSEVAIGECTALTQSFSSHALSTGDTAADPKDGTKPSVDTPTEPAAYDRFDLGNCIGSGVSWNPLTWVGTPVSCALQWAFKPSPQTVASLKASLDVKASQTVVQDVNDDFHKALPVPPGSENCEGPAFNLQFLGYQIFPKDSHPLSVCPSSGLSFLPVVSKAGITALAGLVALMVVRRRFSNVVGMQNEPGEAEA